jgi:hypothetical protein
MIVELKKEMNINKRQFAFIDEYPQTLQGQSGW